MRTTRLLSVAALALAACLIAVGAAWAFETEWLVEGKSLSELEVEKEEITLTSKPVALLVPSLELEIECETSEGSGAITQGGGEEFEATLSGCSTNVKFCEVEPIVVSVKTKVIYTGEAFYYEVVPIESEAPIATIHFTGGLCFLPSEATVEGAFAAEFSQEEELEPPLKFSEAISKTVNAALSEEEEPELTLQFGEKDTAYFSGEFVPPLTVQPRREFPGTQLCEIKVGFCPTGKAHASKTWIEAGSNAAVEISWGVPLIKAECPESEFRTKTLATIGAPLLATTANTDITFERCNNGCSITPIGMPYVVHIVTTGGGNGQILVRELSLLIACGGQECVFGTKEAFFGVTGGGPESAEFAKLSLVPQWLYKEEGSEKECPEKAVWQKFGGGTLSFMVTQPEEKDLYVTG